MKTRSVLEQTLMHEQVNLFKALGKSIYKIEIKEMRIKKKKIWKRSYFFFPFFGLQQPQHPLYVLRAHRPANNAIK